MLVENSVVISLVVDPGSRVNALGDPDAVLEFPAVRGLYRQEGFARFDQSGSASVRFVSREEPQLVQRRNFARVDVIRPVSVSISGATLATFDTLNVSANGLLLGPPPPGVQPLKLGIAAWLKMRLDDDEEPIEARGTAVREAAGGAVGVRFDHITEDHQERLVRFVFRQELEQRRKVNQ
jgi:c-di-GMP-binding flagellar brake protein YcgR